MQHAAGAHNFHVGVASAKHQPLVPEGLCDRAGKAIGGCLQSTLNLIPKSSRHGPQDLLVRYDNDTTSSRSSSSSNFPWKHAELHCTQLLQSPTTKTVFWRYLDILQGLRSRQAPQGRTLQSWASHESTTKNININSNGLLYWWNTILFDDDL